MALGLLLPALAAAETRYAIDPSHSSAQFSVKHMMITNVRGELSKVTGNAIWDHQNLAASRLEATVDTSTVNNRKDFGLNWNKALETGGVLVGEEVKITLDVQLVRKAS